GGRAHPGCPNVLETTGDGMGSWEADRIEQALTNLVVNAIQHGDGGPILVRSIASAADKVEISVRNAGAVIPADVLPQLFKAYRRGIHGKPTDHRSGVGLGLFIVAQIAQAHGGRAWAESSAEAGTTFTIELPRVFPRKGSRGQEGGSPKDTDFERSSRHGPRIKGLAICSHWIDRCPVAITNGKCSASAQEQVEWAPLHPATCE